MNFNDLQKGSYKGVPFLMASGSVAGGNKNVVHAYPNSSRQSVENLGQTPRSFTLSLIIPSTNYAQRRDDLLRVIEEGTPGPLIHPLYGRIENVLVGPFTLTEDLTELGDGKLSVPFLIDNGPNVPQEAGVSVSAVAKKRAALDSALETGLSDGFNVTPGFLGSFEAATAAVQDVATTLQMGVNAAVDQVSDYIRAVQDLSDSAAALVQVPSNLANSLTALQAQANGIFDNLADAYANFQGHFSVGILTTVPDAVTGTAAQIETATNTNALTTFNRTQALGYAYENVVQLTFVTVDDVNTVQDQLSEQFYAVVDRPELSTAARDALIDLRLAAYDRLEAAKLTARQVVTVNTHPTTARLLAFRYYGNDDSGEAVADLNGRNVANLSRDVSILVDGA